MKDISHERKQQCENYEHDQDNLVLLLDIGHGTFPDILGYFSHGWSTFVLLPHLSIEEPGKKQCQDRCGRNQIE